MFYYSDNALGIGAYFNDSKFNKIYKKAVAMPESPARTALYEQLNQMLGEHVPVIFVVHPTHFSLYQSWVKNDCFTEFHYGTEQYLDVDRSKK